MTYKEDKYISRYIDKHLFYYFFFFFKEKVGSGLAHLALPKSAHYGALFKSIRKQVYSFSLFPLAFRYSQM